MILIRYSSVLKLNWILRLDSTQTRTRWVMNLNPDSRLGIKTRRVWVSRVSSFRIKYFLEKSKFVIKLKL